MRILVEPFHAGYMQRALIELVLIAILAGVVGTHIVIRKLAFVTEAATHTVFPGVASASPLGVHPIAGGFGSGVLASACVATLTSPRAIRSQRSRRVRPDDAVSVVLTTFFAAGVIVVSRRQSFASDLMHLFFGRILAVNFLLIAQTAVIVAVVTLAVAAMHRWLVLRAFDETAAEASGIRVAAIDMALHIMIVFAVIGALRAVGTLVALCLIIGPPACARLLRPSVSYMIVAGTIIGAVASWVGLGLSYELSAHHHINVGSSAMVAAAVTFTFVVVRIATAFKAFRQATR